MEEALMKSIEKWEKNSQADCPEDVRMGVRECPLCDEFYAEDCRGCPVLEETGKEYCEGTPYYGAFRALSRWRINGTPEDRELFQQAAREEVDFLRSLKQKEEPWETLAKLAGFLPSDTETSARRAFRFCADHVEYRLSLLRTENIELINQNDSLRHSIEILESRCEEFQARTLELEKTLKMAADHMLHYMSDDKEPLSSILAKLKK